MLMLWATTTARAEGLEGYDLSEMESAGAGLIENVVSFVEGLAAGTVELDFRAWLQKAAEVVKNTFRQAAVMGMTFLAVMLFSGINERLGHAGRGAGMVCYLAGATTLLGWLADGLMEVAAVSVRLRSLSEGINPILTGILTAVGAQSTSAAFVAMAGFMQWAAGRLLTTVVPGLCCASAALAATGNLHETVRLKKLSKILSDTAGWICGGLITAFLAAAMMTGSMASAQDGAALRSAKFAVDNLFPVVGGELSNAMNAAAGSAVVLKNAVGVTGMILILWTCLKPMVRLGVSLVILRLAAALAEPVCGGQMIDMAEGFSAAFRGLMAALAASVVLLLIWIGTAMAAGQMAVSIVS